MGVSNWSAKACICMLLLLVVLLLGFWLAHHLTASPVCLALPATTRNSLALACAAASKHHKSLLSRTNSGKVVLPDEVAEDNTQVQSPETRDSISGTVVSASACRSLAYALCYLNVVLLPGRSLRTPCSGHAYLKRFPPSE